MTEVRYTYEQVADRIEQVLGERPTAKQLHGGERDPNRPVRGQIRLTAGMPEPIARTRPQQFRADDVERWLRAHPRLLAREAASALRESLAGTFGKEDPPTREVRDRAVVAARAAGLSWAQVAEVISEVDERPVTRQAVAKRYSSIA